MARHEGYDLENAEFFDNYSLYLLSIIYILKNGISAPGINIPSVSHLRLAEGVHEVQGVLDLANLRSVIRYLKDYDEQLIS
ncbi:hypothetical protein BGZ65_011523, partial [Modicella reniformis]